LAVPRDDAERPLRPALNLKQNDAGSDAAQTGDYFSLLALAVIAAGGLVSRSRGVAQVARS
jgi:hypothetical protein